MSRKNPDYVPISQIAGVKPTFKWGRAVRIAIYSDEYSAKLFDAICACAYRPSFALGIAAAEWTVARFAGQTDVADVRNRLEAGWVCAIEPAHVRDLRWRFSENVETPTNRINGPMEVLCALLAKMQRHLRRRDPDVLEPVGRQILLARHVLPENSGFEKWLVESLKRLARQFPGDQGPDGLNFERFLGEAVPREFFEYGFTYSPAESNKLLQAFLASVKPGENPYLIPADEMLAAGYKGTPYVL